MHVEFSEDAAKVCLKFANLRYNRGLENENSRF